MSQPVLSVVGVAKAFGGAAALKGVSVDFRPGEIHALMGMNGAGKSTLVQVISGAITPDDGHVEIAGDRVHLSARRARALGVATVPQRREIVPELTVAENIVLGVVPNRAWVVDWRRMRRQAAETLADLGIGLDVNRVCGELTVAEQTLVEVAREVSRGGRVLILDEPTACLGVEAAEQVHSGYGGCGTPGSRSSTSRTTSTRSSTSPTGSRSCARASSSPPRHGRSSMLTSSSAPWSAATWSPDEVSVRLPASRSASRSEASATAASSRSSRSTYAAARPSRSSGPRATPSPSSSTSSPAGSPEEGALEVDGHHVPLGRIGASLRSGLRCITGDRRRLGLVLGLSIDENMLLAHDRLSRRRLHRTKDLAQRGNPLRERFRVKSLTRNPPVAELSGGNQQKVLLAKWLHTDPVACFLEDPTNGVDISAMAEIHQHIDDLVKQGAAVLLASSSAEEVMRLADHVVVVRGGRIVARRDITDITRDELVALTLGGTPS